MDFVIDLHDSDEVIHQKAKEVAKLLKWQDVAIEDMSLVQLTGGTTNILFKLTNVKDPEGEEILVRVYGEGTENLVNRDYENTIFAKLSELKMSAPLYAHFGNGRIEGFIKNSRSCTPEEMTTPKIQKFIAEGLSEFHVLDMPGAGSVYFWNKMTEWFECSKGLVVDSNPKAADYDKLIKAVLSEVDWLSTVIPDAEGKTTEDMLMKTLKEGDMRVVMPEGVTCTETDLLWCLRLMSDVRFLQGDTCSGNVMLSTDCPDKVILIDYEYSSYNLIGFEFGNHFCEYTGFKCDYENEYPSHSSKTNFFSHYIDARFAAGKFLPENSDEVDKTACAHILSQLANRYALASHLMWVAWGLMQASFSSIDFDFLGYSQMRFDGYHINKKQFIAEINKGL
eukprot:TRINITY_DN616616_c0_g1_i1.p1 TRINITY_DN616616_c0_g1~~TRINITY_DN616616_c0_g1_i1.p1  ORF type:complete len:394 (+),score=143.47 TRINITY_DN616616_c0_g1_i1:58-1239(+)